MITVNVCLDSGLLATDACRSDVRAGEGFSRIAEARVYREDAPKLTCDKHVTVDYCTTGGGVATEYCHKFAGVEDVSIDARALLKMTASEIQTIKSALSAGLRSAFGDSRYVYYISESGDPLDWHGFDGNANDGISAPYVVCPAHNSETWNAYLASLVPETPTDGSGETTVPEGDHGIVG